MDTPPLAVKLVAVLPAPVLESPALGVAGASEKPTTETGVFANLDNVHFVFREH